MRLWLANLFLSFVALTGTPALAFDGSGDDRGHRLGQCIVSVTDNRQVAGVFLDSDFFPGLAGGSYWVFDNGAFVQSGTGQPINKGTLSFCLGISTEYISDLTQIGADALVGYASQTYIGFRFTVDGHCASSVIGGTFEYFIGSSPYGGGTKNQHVSFCGHFGSSGPRHTEHTSTALVSTARNHLASQTSNTLHFIGQGRDRFIASRNQMAGDGAGITSRNIVPFDIDGTLMANATRLSSSGTFFGQSGNFEGTVRQLVVGDFNLQHDSASDSTAATLTSRIAWERMLSDDTMFGYFVGGQLAHSDMGGSFSGTQNSLGLTAGAHVISTLQDRLFLSGFVSFGADSNDVNLRNSAVRMHGKYTTSTATIGASLSGVIDFENYEIWPEVILHHGRTNIGTIGLTESNANIDTQVSLNAGHVSISTLTLRPEFRMAIEGRSAGHTQSRVSFSPRLVCEQIRAATVIQDCGGGAEIGATSISNDGRFNFTSRIVMDRISSTTRSSVQLNVKYTF